MNSNPNSPDVQRPYPTLPQDVFGHLQGFMQENQMIQEQIFSQSDSSLPTLCSTFGATMGWASCDY